MVKVKKYIDSRILNRAQISRILDHVAREYTERSDIKKLDEIDVYVTKDPLRVSKKIFSEAKLERYGELKDWILSATPHFSYWERGKVPIILINANEKIFKDNNWEAVRGLVAHELIHILNKMDGIEETLEEQL